MMYNNFDHCPYFLIEEIRKKISFPQEAPEYLTKNPISEAIYSYQFARKRRRKRKKVELKPNELFIDDLILLPEEPSPEMLKIKSKHHKTLYVIEKWRFFYEWFYELLLKSSEKHHTIINELIKILISVHEELYKFCRFKEIEVSYSIESKLKTIIFQAQSMCLNNNIKMFSKKQVSFLEKNLNEILLINHKMRQSL